MIRSLPLDVFLDYMAVLLNHPKAADSDITLNLVMPDVGEEVEITVGNGVMNYTLGKRGEDADATVTMNRTVLDDINLGRTTLVAAVENGSIAVEGDRAKAEEFTSLLGGFDFWFNIVTP
jgi:alkyl sulfatase BDS1-like metallo-beta-lactamase superfamily hydrolase